MEFSGKHSFTLHPSLTLTDRITDRETQTFSLRGLEELFFLLCCCVSFWFWQEIGFGFTYLHTLLNNFIGTNIFLIVVEVLRYLVRQFRQFCTKNFVESKFSFKHRNRYSEGMVTDRKLHVNTLIFIPM